MTIRDLLMGVAAVALLVIGGNAANAGGMFPGVPSATPPLYGAECIPADTGFAAGVNPQTECVSPTQLKNFFAYPTVVSEATPVTLDLSTGPLFKITLTMTRSFVTPTNWISGQVFRLLVTRTVSNAGITFANPPFVWAAQSNATANSAAISPVWSQSANTFDIIDFVTDGTRIFANPYGVNFR